ncbi:hypothetical protein LXL04_037810 [Taraxacum kok-saghyz]
MAISASSSFFTSSNLPYIHTNSQDRSQPPSVSEEFGFLLLTPQQRPRPRRPLGRIGADIGDVKAAYRRLEETKLQASHLLPSKTHVTSPNSAAVAEPSDETFVGIECDEGILHIFLSGFPHKSRFLAKYSSF